MGFGNYDEVTCPECKDKVEGIVWRQSLGKSVCWKCATEVPELSEAEARLEQAQVQFDRAVVDLEKAKLKVQNLEKP